MYGLEGRCGCSGTEGVDMAVVYRWALAAPTLSTLGTHSELLGAGVCKLHFPGCLSR